MKYVLSRSSVAARSLNRRFFVLGLFCPLVKFSCFATRAKMSVNLKRKKNMFLSLYLTERTFASVLKRFLKLFHFLKIGLDADLRVQFWNSITRIDHCHNCLIHVTINETFHEKKTFPDLSNKQIELIIHWNFQTSIFGVRWRLRSYKNPPSSSSGSFLQRSWRSVKWGTVPLLSLPSKELLETLCTRLESICSVFRSRETPFRISTTDMGA